MHRKRKNRGSKWELNWVRHYGGGQTDQGEVLNDCCHVTSVTGTLYSGVILLQKFKKNSEKFFKKKAFSL